VLKEGWGKRAHSENGGEGGGGSVGGGGHSAGETSGVPPPAAEFVFKPYVSKRKKGLAHPGPCANASPPAC